MSAALDNETGIDLSQYTADLGRAARAAAAELAHAQPQDKNRALLEIAAVLDQQRATILQEKKKTWGRLAITGSAPRCWNDWNSTRHVSMR